MLIPKRSDSGRKDITIYRCLSDRGLFCCRSWSAQKGWTLIWKPQHLQEKQGHFFQETSKDLLEKNPREQFELLGAYSHNPQKTITKKFDVDPQQCPVKIPKDFSTRIKTATCWEDGGEVLPELSVCSIFPFILVISCITWRGAGDADCTGWHHQRGWHQICTLHQYRVN